jgi:hypothetical protein
VISGIQHEDPQQCINEVRGTRLDNTFHTEGFFRRESSIIRQLVDLTAAPEHEPDPEPEPKSQLGFDFWTYLAPRWHP